MKAFLSVVVFVVVFLGVIYGGFWIAKKTSYFFFYEDFVKETIKEVVKPEALK